MKWTYSYLPIICAAILAGRENRRTLTRGLEAIRNSLELLAAERDRVQQDWLTWRRARHEVMGMRTLSEISSTELLAWKNAVKDLTLFMETGLIDYVYKARSRAQLADLCQRRYSQEWLALTSVDSPASSFRRRPLRLSA